MKKIGLITLYGLFNYGNRLQNYAGQKVLENLGYEVKTIINKSFFPKDSLLSKCKRIVKNVIFKRKRELFFVEQKRIKNFKRFDSLILKHEVDDSYVSKLKNDYNFFVVGSDQVWNPYFIEDIDWYFLSFCDKKQKLTLAPSIGINTIEKEYLTIFKEKLDSFGNISCREKQGANIITSITGKSVDVVLDPTMMLTKDEWDKIITEPKGFKKKDYVLLYFLGEESEELHDVLVELSKKYKIIRLMDKNSEYYQCGPEQFVWFIKNSSLMITDSFHGCAFSILYHTPFVIFDRAVNGFSMNSRLLTLLDSFGFEGRGFYELEKSKYFNMNFDKSDIILERKRKESYKFLVNSIENLESDI